MRRLIALYRAWRLRRNRRWLAESVGVIAAKPKADPRSSQQLFARMMRHD